MFDDLEWFEVWIGPGATGFPGVQVVLGFPGRVDIYDPQERPVAYSFEQYEPAHQNLSEDEYVQVGLREDGDWGRTVF